MLITSPQISGLTWDKSRNRYAAYIVDIIGLETRFLPLCEVGQLNSVPDFRFVLITSIVTVEYNTAIRTCRCVAAAHTFYSMAHSHFNREKKSI